MKSLERDINIELQNAQYQHQKKEKKEVENWLKEVQHIKEGVQKIEQEVGKRRCFSISRFLKQFEERIKK